MYLKNYTSNVPEQETVHRIEKVLIRCGALRHHQGIHQHGR